MRDLKNVTFETNTTQHPKEDFKKKKKKKKKKSQKKKTDLQSTVPKKKKKLAVSGELGILLFCPRLWPP